MSAINDAREELDRALSASDTERIQAAIKALSDAVDAGPLPNRGKVAGKEEALRRFGTRQGPSAALLEDTAKRVLEMATR